MFLNILENLSGVLDRPQDGCSSSGPGLGLGSTLRASLWFLLNLSHTRFPHSSQLFGMWAGLPQPAGRYEG